MNLLLDTHVLIWLFDEQSPLKSDKRACLADRAHTLTVSAASIWEISIKQSLGRLRAPENILSLLELNATRILPITAEHAYAARSLPPMHGDPFDRMLVVQALLEGLTLVTHDEKIKAYAVPCMMV